MSEECHDEGDEKEDTDGKRLVLEKGSQSINAVFHWGAISHALEIVEETWVADTVAVEAGFKLSGKPIEFLSDWLDSTLVARV